MIESGIHPICTSRREALGFMCLSLLLLAPLFVSVGIGPNGRQLKLSLPRVHSGDEPHYLIQINSLLRDGDLDLANNYRAVHKGGADAGESFRSNALDHHVAWFVDGRHVYWREIYTTKRADWQSDANGRPVPVRRKDAKGPNVPVAGPEYSHHPPWLAIMLATVVSPLANTLWVEPAAIVCSGIAVVASLFCFRSLIRPYFDNPMDRLLVAGITYLGTPIWHYSQTLFTEPYALLCVIGAYAVFLRRDMYFMAGLFVAAAILLKPSFVLLGIPLAGDLFIGRKWTGLCKLLAPCTAAVGIIFLGNQYMFGSWNRMSLRWSTGDPLSGSIDLLFSEAHGLVPFVPASLVAVSAWPALLRTRPREGVILVSAVVLHICLLASWTYSGGGYCYGPRYLVPILPLLLAALPALNTCDPLAFADTARRTVYGLYGLSVLWNAVGAFCGIHVWSVHPVRVILQLFGMRE